MGQKENITFYFSEIMIYVIRYKFINQLTLSSFLISSSPIFLPIAVSSSPTPKISVRRSANCFKLASIAGPKNKYIVSLLYM